MLTSNEFYTDAQRQLQARHDSVKLADVVVQAIVRDEIEPPHVPFIESRDFFFLSTVSAEGEPTVSYKGGAPGLVRVLDSRTLVFPNYDGNGMFKSMGNISEAGKVGLLFIDMETPNRVRVQGTATLSADDPELARLSRRQHAGAGGCDGLFSQLRALHPHAYADCAEPLCSGREGRTAVPELETDRSGAGRASRQGRGPCGGGRRHHQL
nr:pyridoxamine 5'-phosphate oxidase family protein [Hoeflea alexandrii]